MIAAIQARLDLLPVLRLVSGAADFETASETRPSATPAAYVIPLHETPLPNALGCAVAQQVSASFGIAIAVSNVADNRGKAALVDLATVRQATGPQLLGWSPAAGASPLEYVGGSLLGLKNGVLWWQDVYSTDFIIKA